jgi:hypothetical protein
MEGYDLLQIFFGRFDTFQNLWSLYITVVFGLLAFVAAAEQAMKSRVVRALLSSGFVLFAVLNWYALYRVSIQRVAISDALFEILKESPSEISAAIVKAGLPSSSGQLTAFHFFVDAMVIFLILMVPRFRARNKPANNANEADVKS